MIPRRKEDMNGHGAVILLQRYAQLIITLSAVGAMMYGAMTHFATAADVENKFSSLRVEIKVVALEARRDRIKDELFKLRSEAQQTRNVQAQIDRFEGELRDILERLRDLERRRQ